MKVAVITGASAGLGIEFARCAAALTEIEEIWLIARRRERLESLAAELTGKKTRVIPLDLSREDSLDRFEQICAEERPDIKLMINNAGFGTIGDFKDADRAAQQGMIDLNVRALTGLSRIALDYIGRGGCIINTCSIASFAPNPGMTVYCSTKAFVKSFSYSLRFELKERGINVLAVCPGPMDTEFLAVAGITPGVSHTFDTLPRCSPAKTAQKAVKRALRGKAIYTPKPFFKFYHLLSKVLPHSIVMHMSKT